MSQQARCKRCGQFIDAEFIESPYCDPCLDEAWAEFMAGDTARGIAEGAAR